MYKSKFKECMKPWAQMQTWHTTNSCDMARFHKSLQDYFLKTSTGIDYDTAKENIAELIKELHPNTDINAVEKDIERYASTAEKITTFIQDTSSVFEN